MVEYILIIVFIVGLASGAVLTVYGLKLGFKLSYEIRNHAEGGEGQRLFPDKEPAEVSLIDPDDLDEGDVDEGAI